MSRIEDRDRVLAYGDVGTAESKPEGVKIVFLVHRGRSYLVEEVTAFTYLFRIFDSDQRKRDSHRAYRRALRTPKLILLPN